MPHVKTEVPNRNRDSLFTVRGFAVLLTTRGENGLLTHLREYRLNSRDAGTGHPA